MFVIQLELAIITYLGFIYPPASWQLPQYGKLPEHESSRAFPFYPSFNNFFLPKVNGTELFYFFSTNILEMLEYSGIIILLNTCVSPLFIYVCTDSIFSITVNGNVARLPVKLNVNNCLWITVAIILINYCKISGS